MPAPLCRSQKQFLCGESDRRLVELARAGSVEAFEAIVLRYRQPLLRHCRRMLTLAEAEDAVQEAFLAAYRTINRTSRELRLGAWLFRIAHNAALGILRRRVSTAALDELPAVGEAPHDAVMRQQRLRDTVAAISLLPEIERQVLVERAFAGRGHREIANRLGRSEGAVRQLLNRARSRLRELVGALAPLFVRLLPTSSDEQLVGVSLARRGGAILAAGVTALGGGSAVLSAGLVPGVSHPADGGRLSRQAVGSAQRAHVGSRLTARTTRPVIGSSGAQQNRQSEGATQRSSMTRLGKLPAARARRGGVRRTSPIDRSGVVIAAPGSGSDKSGTNGTPTAAGGGFSDTARVFTQSHAGAAPAGARSSATAGSATAGESGRPPGRSGTPPRQLRALMAQPGASPGHSGAAGTVERSAPDVTLGASRAPAVRASPRSTAQEVGRVHCRAPVSTRTPCALKS